MILCYDVELEKSIAEIGGWGQVGSGKSGISCAVVQSPISWKSWIFLKDNLSYLPKLLDSADLVVTWNGNLFDDKVLAGCKLSANKAPRFDILAAIFKQKGRQKGWALNETAERNGVGKKLAKGYDIPNLFKEDKIGELITYCARDTWLLCGLFNLIKTREYLIGPNEQRVHFPRFITNGSKAEGERVLV